MGGAWGFKEGTEEAQSEKLKMTPPALPKARRARRSASAGDDIRACWGVRSGAFLFCVDTYLFSQTQGWFTALVFRDSAETAGPPWGSRGYHGE